MTFDFIAKKFAQPVQQEPDRSKYPWWCEDCGCQIPGTAVTYQERHDERAGGCGCIVHPYCDTCESNGWVQVFSHNPPAFGTCPDCYNPFDRPSP